MLSEVVNIDAFADSAVVRCTFSMVNNGDSVTLPVGFPVMNFFHSDITPYDERDKAQFEIYVDNAKLDESDIRVPVEMQGTYDRYLRVRHADKEYQRKLDSVKVRYGVIEGKRSTKVTKGSYAAYEKADYKVADWREKQPMLDFKLMNEFDSLIAKGNYPWYVWRMKFARGESRTIRVNYTVPPGMTKGAESRYVKYLLSTGAGWQDNIKRADVSVKLHDVNMGAIELISPGNHRVDKRLKTINWTFTDLEPTTKDDIYVKYYDAEERRKYDAFRRK